MSENGSERPSAQLILTFDLATFALDIKGEVTNCDCALAMLAQASRYFETQQRISAVAQVQQQVAEREINDRVNLELRRTRGLVRG